MGGRLSPPRIARAVLGVVIACVVPLGAQPLDRYTGFEWDSVFRIGAHTVPGYVTFARDTLKLDFTYHYQPTWDNRGVSALATRLLSPQNVFERLDTSLYLQSGTPDSLALRTIFVPDALKVMVGYLDVTDNFAYHNPALQMFTYDARYGALSAITVANDSTMLQTLSPPAATAGPLVMHPRYISTGGFRRSDSARYCDSAMYPFFDIGNGNTALGHDSSYKVRFSFHIRVDGSDELPRSTVVARVILWRRLTTGAARCAIYEPFDTVAITKGEYDDANRLDYPLQMFKDVGFWVDVRDSTRLGWFNAYDTTYYRSMLGAWIGDRDPAPASVARCQSYLDSLTAIPGRLKDGTELRVSVVEGSDVYYDVHTTGAAKIIFLRGRVATHQFEALLDHRFDSHIENEVRALFTDSNTAIIRKRLFRLGLYDEPSTTTFAAHAYLTDTLRALIARHSPDSGKPWIYQNPTLNYDGFRRLQFDFDPTLPKRAHLMTRQQLAVIQAPVPIYYVRPDKMVRPGFDSNAWQSYYPPGAAGLVAFNTAAGYKRYTDAIQASLGAFADYPNIQVTKEAVPTLGRMVSVAKFEHAGVMPDSIPVYNVVTSYGAPGHTDSAGFVGGWLQTIRPKTPEELAVQSFLTIQGGAQGLEFDELSWDGRNLGIADRVIGVGRVNWSAPCASWPSRDSVAWDTCDCGEWDILPSNHSKDTILGGATDPKWILPQMWLGLRSRYLATKRIVEELRRIAPVYERLYYRMEQMSVHDTRQSFDSMPMVAGLRMQRADTAVRDSIVGLATSDSVDARESTYAELTHFYPGSRDVAGVAARSRYLALTNRRTFPSDHARYGRRTDSLDGSSSARGFGFIDVRRPLITLKNSTPVMADAFLIEKVGHEDSLRWVAKAGEELALDWLEPGWGGLYRITPVTTGISLEGTAYNNAVRSENPSTDLAARDRIVVYERDSIVYLRTVDSTGTWSKELRVSDANDAADTMAAPGWQRRAACIHPGIATVRDSTTTLVVWERIDAGSGLVTIEGTMLHALPTARDDSLGSRVRMRIAPARPPLLEATAHAPSVVGLNGGYAVAYPSTGTGGGISVSLIRSRTSGSALSTNDSFSTHHVRWTGPTPPTLIDSTYFPTLAFAGRAQVLDSAGWTQKNQQSLPRLEAMVVHLAYQQGRLAREANQQIMHTMIGAHFLAAQQPIIWVSPTEHVSAGIPDCGFRHPSIAADSARIGVAFQGTYEQRIILRFRDAISVAAVPRWRAPIYSWGSSWSHRFDWPSLTQFPAVDSVELEFRGDGYYGLDGALVWSRPDVPGDSTSQVFMYRYGWSAPRRVPDGMHPTLTLVGRRGSNYLEASSILMHGDSTSRSSGPRPASTTGTYYPAILDNNPTSPSPNFVTDAPTYRSMIATGSIRRFPDPAPCPMVGSLDFGIIVKGPIVRTPPVPPDSPGVTPSFFGPTPWLTPPITTTEEITSVTRTGVFTQSPLSMSIDRVVMRGAELLEWLDAEPYDTIAGEPHDILILTELVRDADGAVLWSDDTISARAMEADTLKETVTIPSHLTDTGTVMYVRLRAVPSDSLAYAASAGFFWDFDAPASWVLPRRTRLEDARPSPGPGLPPQVRLSVVPNPITGAATPTVATERAGMFRLGLFDAMGRRVHTYPPVVAARPGAYSVGIDLDGITEGVYLMRVEDAQVVRSVTVTVVR